MTLASDLSLGWQTDLIFARFDGLVHTCDDHVAVRTPTNPSYWWGNFLIFRQAPQNGDLARWQAAFERAITAHQPQSRHMTFGVDLAGPLALPPDFADAGFELQQTAVLTLSAHQPRVPAARMPEGFAWHVLDVNQHQQAIVAQQVAVDAVRYEIAGYRQFAERQMSRYAAMQAAGLGHWFGMVARDSMSPTLAATCGLFRDPARPGLGRFQYVSTHPAWQRRGLCTALVSATVEFAFAHMHLQQLVIVANPAEHALGIYRSLGFQPAASAWQLERPPPSQAATQGITSPRPPPGDPTAG